MSTMKLEKITNSMPSARRRYEDACGAAHALDLLGERWALLVVRELMLGPQRFSDLRSGLPGISANVLTQRLEGLEASGIVTRRKLPPPVSAQVYELTPWGYEAEPIFQALGRWGARSPHHDPTLPFSAASLILSLRTMFDARRAGRIDAWVGIKAGPESTLVRIEGGKLDFARGELDDADLILEGEPPALAAAIYGGAPIEGLVSQGMLKVTGDRRFAEIFVRLFPLPDKVAGYGRD
jgi:DNA-binding HxlR family transcriptional regulator